MTECKYCNRNLMSVPRLGFLEVCENINCVKEQARAEERAEWKQRIDNLIGNLAGLLSDEGDVYNMTKKLKSLKGGMK